MPSLTRIEKNIHKAAKNGDIKLLKKVTKLDAFKKRWVNSKDQDDDEKNTPLHTASQKGHLEIVKILIRLGANVNAKNEEDWTPLNSAAESGEFEVMKYLIEHGAKVNTKNYDGDTPLHSAACNGDIGVVKCLIEHGAKIDMKNESGDTPLNLPLNLENLK